MSVEFLLSGRENLDTGSVTFMFTHLSLSVISLSLTNIIKMVSSSASPNWLRKESFKEENKPMSLDRTTSEQLLPGTFPWRDGPLMFKEITGPLLVRSGRRRIQKQKWNLFYELE